MFLPTSPAAPCPVAVVVQVLIEKLVQHILSIGKGTDKDAVAKDLLDLENKHVNAAVAEHVALRAKHDLLTTLRSSAYLKGTVNPNVQRLVSYLKNTKHACMEVYTVQQIMDLYAR